MIQASADALWAQKKSAKESEKSPPELEEYFRLLNICKIRPEDVEHAMLELEEVLNVDDALPGYKRKNLRIYLDRDFDPSANYEYETLPKRAVTTTVEGEWEVNFDLENTAPEVFPNGLGKSFTPDRVRPARKRQITRQMIIDEEIVKYKANPTKYLADRGAGDSESVSDDERSSGATDDRKTMSRNMKDILKKVRGE